MDFSRHFRETVRCLRVARFLAGFKIANWGEGSDSTPMLGSNEGGVPPSLLARPDLVDGIASPCQVIKLQRSHDGFGTVSKIIFLWVSHVSGAYPAHCVVSLSLLTPAEVSVLLTATTLDWPCVHFLAIGQPLTRARWISRDKSQCGCGG